MTAWAVTSRKWFHRFSLTFLTRFIRLCSRFMPYHLGVRAGGVLGVIAYYFLPRQRNRALSHLTSVFAENGEAWIRRTARQSFSHLGKSLLEFLLMNPQRLSKTVDFEWQGALQHAAAEGRGVVCFTGHIGNWELMAAAVASSFPVSVIAAPIEPEAVNDMILQLRARMGVKTILRGKPGAARELIRIFKENRVLGILIDQDTDVEGAFVDFMGRPAWTPTAAAQMALRFDAPVLFIYTRRTGNDQHRIIAEGPIELIRTGDHEKDMVINTAVFTKQIEDAIMRHPEQWVWMHRRWRRQP